MSTNYYARLNCCVACGRHDQIHLGKRSAGWRFNFQGSYSIRNFDQWCDLVRSADAIFDEYLTPMTADEMITLAREWQQGKSHSLLYADPHNWRDENGFEFTEHEFS